MRKRNFYFLFAALFANFSLSANEKFPQEFFEAGFERLHAAAPAEDAIFSGILLRLYFSPNVYVGTTQSSLSYKRRSEYRPDFHAGLRMPLAGGFAFEGAIGVDFFTALIIALYIIDEDNALDYKFASNFYSPYFTLSAGLRYEFDMFALRLITQTQFGGYLESQSQAFNASIWLGFGATVRFTL